MTYLLFFFEILRIGNSFIWYSHCESKLHSGSNNVGLANYTKVFLKYTICTMCQFTDMGSTFRTLIAYYESLEWRAAHVCSWIGINIQMPPIYFSYGAF